jgi:hypothetical protein
MMNFIACRLDMWHAWGKGEVFTGFWLGGPKGRDHWEDLGVCEMFKQHEP